MSDQAGNFFQHWKTLASVMVIAGMAWVVTIVGILFPATGHAGESNPRSAPPLPRLVRAGQGDTPETLASRYLNDAGKAWTIVEYNGVDAFTEGQAVLIPMAPFRRGGLASDGYQTVPVLAYTDIAESPGEPGQIARTDFEAQLAWLKENNFNSIRPEDLIAFMDFTGQLPRRAVLISVDTQSRHFFDFGLPLLQKYGFTATLFVATRGVGRKSAMTWEQLEMLQQMGFTIGCRGRGGRSLTRRQKGQRSEDHFKWMAAELRQAKQTIEIRLGTACKFLACPEGDTNELLVAAAVKIGYTAIFSRKTEVIPFFGDRYAIPRIVIDPRTTLSSFADQMTPMNQAELN
ncbi:polysaccharide deacetylase family protein [Desulfosarcina ovata]|nr:polysaccharide deacetylase family protein [Desulfosarcina ovata]